MKKRSQASQIFVYIIAVVLAAMILLYGYRAISGFINRTEQITEVKFKTDIENAIRLISTDYGSVKKLELNVPGKYETVCIVQQDYQNKQGTQLCAQSPIICSAWTTQAQNIFLTDTNMYTLPEIQITTLPLEIQGGYICLKVKAGKITLRIEGKGDKTGVSEWQ